jgi:hypothetical protein
VTRVRAALGPYDSTTSPATAPPAKVAPGPGPGKGKHGHGGHGADEKD